MTNDGDGEDNDNDHDNENNNDNNDLDPNSDVYPAPLTFDNNLRRYVVRLRSPPRSHLHHLPEQLGQPNP